MLSYVKADQTSLETMRNTFTCMYFVKKLQMFVCFVENWLLLMAVNILAVQMSGCHAGLIMFALHINIKDCIQKDSVFMTVQSQ